MAALMVPLAAWSQTPAASSQRALEDSYLAARDSAIQSLIARAKSGAHAQPGRPVEDSVLSSLEPRLRAIIGPVHAAGFSGAGRGNLEDLYNPGEEGFGKLDALYFISDDHKSELWVTTRHLAARKGLGNIRDIESELRKPDYYTTAIEPSAAIVRYASVALPDARSLGLLQAMVMHAEQDDSRDPPDKLLVTVLRGQRVYIVRAPVAAIIEPPRRCSAIRDSLYARAMEGGHVPYPPTNRADSATLSRSLHYQDMAEIDYLACYDERARLNPGFAKIVAQTHSIVQALP